jgi:hypothetical protein
LDFVPMAVAPNVSEIAAARSFELEYYPRLHEVQIRPVTMTPGWTRSRMPTRYVPGRETEPLKCLITTTKSQN